MAKRIFDFLSAVMGLSIMVAPISVFCLITLIDTKSSGIFTQARVGRYGKIFKIYKIRTINPKTKNISIFGKFLRKSKLDELPQLFNVLKGDMSFVGPRPDISGYYDRLEGENRKILELKPGITSLASIKYRNEEYLLSKQENPSLYNDEVIFPDKVKMNLEYYHNRSFLLDLQIIIKTFI